MAGTGQLRPFAHPEKNVWLAEQQKTAPEGAVRLGDYVIRWLNWTRAGLWELDRSGLLLAPARNTHPGEAQSQQG